MPGEKGTGFLMSQTRGEEGPEPEMKGKRRGGNATSMHKLCQKWYARRTLRRVAQSDTAA